MTPRLKIEFVSPSIPKDLRDCRGAPRTPGKTATQKDAARYVNQLAGAYVDCKTKLRGVVKIIDKTAAEAEKLSESTR